MLEDALDGHTECPCLQLRGILLKILTHVDTDDINTHRIITTLGDVPRPGHWPNGVYYGDGSGGAYSAYPNRRQYGVGLACFSSDVCQFGISYPLPSDIQTAPGAEVSALATLLEMVKDNAHITDIGDNLKVIEN